MTPVGGADGATRRDPSFVGSFFRALFVALRQGWRTSANRRRDREHGGLDYPDESRTGAAAARGVPVLVAELSGAPRCVPCSACTTACPTDCIVVWPQGGGAESPDRFEIDMSRCVYCGLCEAVCPEEAIVLSNEVAIADYERRSLRFDLANLLVPEELLTESLSRARATRSHVRNPVT